MDASRQYVSTVGRCASVTIRETSGCSGASTMYVAPKRVSGRVVKTAIVSPSARPPATSNSTSAPSDLPIQLRCCSLMDSGQSRESRSLSSRSAYAVILSIHCGRGRRTQGWFPRSERPSITSSFARTVPISSHHQTGTSAE